MHREQSHWEQIYIGPVKFHIWEKPTLFCLTRCFLVKTTKINANIETKMISRKASCIMECGPSHLLKWKKKKTLKGLNYTLKAILLEKAPLGNPDCHFVRIGCADLFSIAHFVLSTEHHTQGLAYATETSTTELISNPKVLLLFIFIHLFYILASASLPSPPPPNLHHKSTLKLTKIHY